MIIRNFDIEVKNSHKESHDENDLDEKDTFEQPQNMIDLSIRPEFEHEENKADSDEFRIIQHRDSDEFKIRNRIDSYEYKVEQKSSKPDSEKSSGTPPKPPKPESDKEDKNGLMGIQIRDSFEDELPESVDDPPQSESEKLHIDLVDKPKYRFKKKKIKRIDRRHKESSSKEISNIKSDSSDTLRKTENEGNTPNISQVKVGLNEFKNEFDQNQPIQYDEKIEQNSMKKKKRKLKKKKHFEPDQTLDQAREARYQLPVSEAPNEPKVVLESNPSAYIAQPEEVPQIVVTEKSTERKKRKAMYPSVERPKGGDSVERTPIYPKVELNIAESVERRKPKTSYPSVERPKAESVERKKTKPAYPSVERPSNNLGNIDLNKVNASEDQFINTKQQFGQEDVEGNAYNNGIEVVKKKKKSKKMFTKEEIKNSSAVESTREIEYKRDGSIQPPTEYEERNRIWGPGDPAEEYSPTKDLNRINQRRLTKQEYNIKYDRKPYHHEEDKKQYSADKRINNPAKMTASEYMQNSMLFSGSKKPSKGSSAVQNDWGRSQTKPREQKKLLTKDFNKFNLQPVALKDKFEDGSSNPSSMNTMNTGKKTLGTQYMKRRIADGSLEHDYYLKKSSQERRQSSKDSRRPDIRSEAGYINQNNKLDENARVAASSLNFNPSNEIQKTIEKSRHNKAVFIATI